MKLHKYQMEYQIINEVHGLADLEELRRYIAEHETKPVDDVTKGHLTACKEALRVYDQSFFKRWSTPFLRMKLAECRRHADIYEAEIGKRGE